VVVVGFRGLSGTEALLGRASDVVVHHAARPVMVVPCPLLSAEYAALIDKAVLVGWDGSTGAQAGSLRRDNSSGTARCWRFRLTPTRSRCRPTWQLTP